MFSSGTCFNRTDLPSSREVRKILVVR